MAARRRSGDVSNQDRTRAVAGGLGRNALTTPRLRLVPASARHLRADLAGRAPLARALGVEVPKDWPPDLVEEDRGAYARHLEREPGTMGWLPWYWCTNHGKDATLVGFGGFGGRPSPEGRVTVSYAVVPSHQRRGYATEAVGVLVAWALSHDDVRVVDAETLPHLGGSIAVLERTGFARVGGASATGMLRYERFE